MTVMETVTHGRILAMVAAVSLLPGACADDKPPTGSGTETDSSSNSTTTSDSADVTGPQFECTPGEVRCNGQAFLETCSPTGLDWISEPCGTNEVCDPCGEAETCAEDRCVGPCEIEADVPSSAGCSFIANRQLHLSEDEPDGLVVTNPTELPATVQLYRTPPGKRKEEPVGDPRVLEPDDETLFLLDGDFSDINTSLFRTGGTYRIESDVPVVAYQHSPLDTSIGNDSSLLLPESTMRRDYVVFSSPGHEELEMALGLGEPSYFEIVALEDFTVVEWTPPVDTAGPGGNINFVYAGETSEPLDMNRFETARIAASANIEMNGDLRDVSGTVIHANKPILVMGASRCSRIPIRDEPARGRCDPLQEMLIPLDYWGERYVAAHSPTRNSEEQFWRIFSSDEEVTVTAEGNLGCNAPIITAENCLPPNEFDDGACIFAARGSWIEVVVETECSFFLDSGNTGAFMPVGYLQSSRDQNEPMMDFAEEGDPAMWQMIPVEQFLSRYVFSTGRNYDFHYAQVIRQVGGPTIFLDNQSVTGFYPVSETYEVADVPLSEGAHVIESGQAFGIVQFGYTSGEESELCENEFANNVCHTSYAYPGGMKSERINIP